MTRQPHVSRRYLPPAEPPRESRLSLAVGLAGIVLVFVLAFFVLPVLAS